MRVEVLKDGGEKRNVLIVSVVLPVTVNFALRSETQGGVEVLGMREQTVLCNVGRRPKPVMRDGQVED